MTIRHSGRGQFWNRNNSPHKQARAIQKDEINSQVTQVYARSKKDRIKRAVVRLCGEKVLRRRSLDSFTGASSATSATHGQKSDFDYQRQKRHQDEQESE